MVLKIKQAAIREWKYSGSPLDELDPCYTHYRLMWRVFQSTEYRVQCTEKQKLLLNQKLMKKMEKCQDCDQKEFWYLLKKEKKYNAPTSLLKSVNEITSDPQEINKCGLNILAH